MTEKETTLANEFAAVKVQLTNTARRLELKITDLSTGVSAYLDPLAVFHTGGQMVIPANQFAAVNVEIDHAANGPRLKIAEQTAGLTIYLDALELSDAAVTGAWGRFPEVYYF